MSDLATLQRHFVDRLFASAEEDADPRFAIYRRGAMANLQGALAAAYPVVLRLVGGAFFGEAARAYGVAHPSRCGDLAAYGDGFPAFLERYPHARGLECLADVARLEWALHHCARAPDGGAVDFSVLASLDPDRFGDIRIALHPAARLVRSMHPVLAICEANQPDRDGTPVRREGPDRVLVHRDGLLPRASRLDAAEWTLASALAAGATLDGALEAVDGPLREGFAPALRRLATLGAFGGIEVAGG